MIAATVLFLSHWSIAVHGSIISLVLLGMTFVLGFFMISTMPYNSFKDIEFIMARPSYVMFGVIVLVTIIAVTPPFMLFLLLLIYTVSGPVRWTAWKIKGKKGFQEGLAVQQGPLAPTPEKFPSEEQTALLEKPGENIQD
jgi:CDP-diacylglycerol--serine O-phosphatidyltransferase